MITPLILNALGSGFQSGGARVQSPVGAPTNPWSHISHASRSRSGEGTSRRAFTQFLQVAQRKSALTSNSREAGGSIPSLEAIFQNQPRVVPSGGFPALSGPSLAGELLPEQLMS